MKKIVKIVAVCFVGIGIVCVVTEMSPVEGMIIMLCFVIGFPVWSSIRADSRKKGKTDVPASGNNSPSNGRASASGRPSQKGSKNSSADIEANQMPAARICPRCGRQQPEGRIFCGECGERLKQQ